jgi:hypothetical protein
MGIRAHGQCPQRARITPAVRQRVLRLVETELAAARA